MQPLSYTRIVQPRVPSDDDALAQRTLAERSKLFDRRSVVVERFLLECSLHMK